MLNNYTHEEVDEAISKLDIIDRQILLLRYGEDLNNPSITKISYEQSCRFYNQLLPKIKRLLNVKNGKEKIYK